MGRDVHGCADQTGYSQSFRFLRDSFPEVGTQIIFGPEFFFLFFFNFGAILTYRPAAPLRTKAAGRQRLR